MTITVGELVHSPVWDSFRGFYVDTYKVLSKQGGVLELEHVGTAYPGGQYLPGSSRIINRPERDFEGTLEERGKRIISDVQAMLEQFDPSKYSKT